uniref:Uncharacterized protein n=1 Tax=Nelumbo nucifera TaxID=4432 RepID=A0A822ZBW8_NELNU|nr:TPA_asm: hypothetical protein HUJ06_001954 [Nelumbo nucifera]
MEAYQCIVEASHSGDLKSASECITDPYADINFISVVCLTLRKTEVLLHDKSANEVRVEYEEVNKEN